MISMKKCVIVYIRTDPETRNRFKEFVRSKRFFNYNEALKHLMDHYHETPIRSFGSKSS